MLSSISGSSKYSPYIISPDKKLGWPLVTVIKSQPHKQPYVLNKTFQESSSKNMPNNVRRKRDYKSPILTSAPKITFKKQKSSQQSRNNHSFTY